MYTLHREIAVASGSASTFSRNLSMTKPDPKGHTHALICARNHLSWVGWDSKMEGMSQDLIAVMDPTTTTASGDKLMFVIQAKYCYVDGRANPILVCCTTAGVVMYEWNGSVTMQWQPMAKPGEDDDMSYTKGIDVISDHICVGNSLGEIMIFSVKDNLVKLRATRKEHKSPVVDLHSDGRNLLASVAMDGTIVVWDGTFKHVSKIDTQLPINCIAVHKNFVIVATVLGAMFVYNVRNSELLCEIAAHARPINALDVAQETGLVLSLSEDSFARIWEIKSVEPFDLDCVHSEVVSNVPLTGGSFSDHKGSAFACTGYDYSTIFYYKGTSTGKSDGKKKKK